MKEISEIPAWPESTLRESDIVFEIGGYRGKWASWVAETYNPYLYIFEPAPKAYGILAEKMKPYPKAKIYNFGLWTESTMLNVGDASRDGASMYSDMKPIVKMKMVDAVQFIGEHDITEIDIMRMNIEGAELELLPYMIENGILEIVKYLMIHWHYITDWAGDRRLIVDKLLRESRVQILDWTNATWCIWVRAWKGVR